MAEFGKLTLDQDHYEVCQSLKNLSRQDLIQLGEAFGLSYTTLEKMDNVLEEMVAAWLNRKDNVLKQSGEPTLETLVKALEKVGQNVIAQDIMKHYSGKLDTRIGESVAAQAFTTDTTVEYEPTERFWHKGIEHQGRVYIRGGQAKNMEFDKLESFDPLDKVWLQIKTKGTPHPGLTQAACVCVDGVLYMYGANDKRVLSQLNMKTFEWSQLWASSEKDNGKTPMMKAASGMIYFSGGYLALFGGHGSPSGHLQFGSEWTSNPYEKNKGWTNEFHLFKISKSVWLSPIIKGKRPPPCSDFALNGISGHRGVLFGGYQHNGSQEELYIIDFDDVKIEVTFTLIEKTKPWPEGRECHTSCVLGLYTEHPQLLISGGKNMRDIPLKFDIWMLNLKTFIWKKVRLPAGKRTPRWGHSMTAVITFPGLEAVIVFGGSPEEFTGKWTSPEFQRVAETVIYTFGSLGTDWVFLDEEKCSSATLEVTTTQFDMDKLFSLKAIFIMEKANYIPLVSELSKKNKEFQLQIEEDQPDFVSAMSKWLKSSSKAKKIEPTWQNLISVLQQVNLGPLAQQLENFLREQTDIGCLMATTVHLGNELLTFSDKMLDKNNILIQRISTFVKHSNDTIHIMKHRYDKDVEQFREQLRTREIEWTKETDRPEHNKGRTVKKEERIATTTNPTMKLESKTEVTMEQSELNQHRIKVLEQELHKLEEKSDSTIKLLQKKNQQLEDENNKLKQQTTTPMETDALAVSVMAEQKNIPVMEVESTSYSQPEDATGKLFLQQKMTKMDQSELPKVKVEGQECQSEITPSNTYTGSASIAGGGEVPSVGDHNLRGVDVCGETTLVITNSSQKFRWKEFGLTLKIRKKSLPQGCVCCRIHIKASLAGQYQFPKDHDLISAIFWFRCEPQRKFAKPITVKMEHCAMTEDAANLTFVRAVCTQKTLPYLFKKIEGTFNNEKCYGNIELSGFSGLATTQKKSATRQYCARIFHFSPNQNRNTSYEVDFVVTWNIVACLTTVLKKYKEKNATLGFDQVIFFKSDRIRIDIPLEGIVVKEGWKILPINRPVIEREIVDSYKQGTVIPKCQFSATFEHQDMQHDSIPPLLHQASLHGAKYPNNIVTFNIEPSTVISDAMSASRKRPASESDATPASKRRYQTHKSKSLDTTYEGPGVQRSECETVFTEAKSSNLSVPNSRNLTVFKWNNNGKIERVHIISEIVNKWKIIGRLLEIPHQKLEKWDKENKDTEDSCVAVLNYWLEDHGQSQDYPVTWEGLCEILYDCKLGTLADRLKSAIKNVVY